MNIGDLTIRLGVKADTYKVRDFSNAIGGLPLKALAVVTAITAITGAILKLTGKALQISNSLELFRSQTGLSIDEMQRWSSVAEQVGVSGDAVASSIMGIQSAIAKLSMGEGGGALLPFGRLGISNVSPDSDAFEILKEIGKNKNKLSRAQMIETMGALGVKPEMMRVFDTGSRFDNMAASTPRMSAADSRAMQDLQVELAKFQITVSKAFVPALTAITPYMGDLAHALTNFVQVVGKGASFFTGKGAVNTTGAGLLWGKTSGMDPGIGDKFLSWIRRLEEEDRKLAQVNVTQNIQSTADANEVARIANENLKRQMDSANKQFNNGGY